MSERDMSPGALAKRLRHLAYCPDRVVNEADGQDVFAAAELLEEMAAEPELGTYAPPRPRNVIHSEVVEFRTDELPRRMPKIRGEGEEGKR